MGNVELGAGIETKWSSSSVKSGTIINLSPLPPFAHNGNKVVRR
jgi:hypothetical protein